MKRLALVVSVLGLTSIAHAADMPRKAAVPSAWSWEGWYLGLHTGAALGISKVSDPYGSSIFGDSVRTPGFPPRRPDRLQLTTARQQMGLWRRSRRQLDRRRRHQYLLRSQRPADLLQLPRQSGFHRHVHRTHRLCRRCRRSHTALCEAAAPCCTTGSTRRRITASASSRSTRRPQARPCGDGPSAPVSSRRCRRRGRSSSNMAT